MDGSSLDISFGHDGRYGISQDPTGHITAVRDGVPHQVLEDNLLVGLAHDLVAARDAVATLAQAVWGMPGAGSDVYQDNQRLLEMKDMCRKVQAHVPAVDRLSQEDPVPLLLVRDSQDKYAVAVMADGSGHAYKHGKRWRDLAGEPMAIALATDLAHARAVARCLSGAVFGHGPSSSPDIYADKDLLDGLEIDVRLMLPCLALGGSARPTKASA